MRVKVGVIIVTYQSESDIGPCLESLGRQTYSPFEVVVVDNGSDDGSVRIARPYGVHIIESKENLGFAGANNIGARYLIDERGCDSVLLLNPDTVSHERLIEELVETLYSSEEFGIVQGKLFLMNEKNLLNASGIRHHYLYFGYCEGYRKPDDNPSDRDIAVASGACLMFRKETLAALGYLFDDDFFMYHEDTDFCIRARLLGYRVMLSGKAIAWHDYRFGTGNKKKFFHMEKNRLFLIIQNYRALTLLLLAPAIIFMEAQVIVHAALEGWFIYKMRAYLWLIGNIGKALRMRRAVQASRVVEDGDIMGLFVTDIGFEEVHNAAIEYITNPVLHFYYGTVLGLIKFLQGGRACTGQGKGVKGVKHAG